MSATTTTLDETVATLRDGVATWAAISLARRRVLLEQMRAATAANAERWVQIAAQIKGLDPRSPLVGEEWISGPYPVLSAVGALIETLRRSRRAAAPSTATRSRP